MEWEKFVESVNDNRLLVDFGAMLQFRTKTKLNYDEVQELWNELVKKVDKLQAEKDKKTLEESIKSQQLN